MQVARDFRIAVDGHRQAALNGQDFILFVGSFNLLRVAQSGSVLRNDTRQPGRETVRVQNVLGADVLHARKLIFGRNIPHLNKLDRVTVAARDV